MNQRTVDDMLQAMSKVTKGIPQELLDHELELTVRTVRLLANGKPISVEQLADSWEMPLKQVKAILEQARGGSLEVDEDGLLVGASGLSQNPTPHRMNIDGQTLYAWCAFDSIFLPGFLGKTVRVESEDLVNGQIIRLTISSEGITELYPSTVMLTLSVLGVSGSSSRVGPESEVCGQINYFTSRESAEQWAKAYPELVILTVEEAYELARRQWHDSLERVLGQGT
jgi:alkylmercury lyase